MSNDIYIRKNLHKEKNLSSDIYTNKNLYKDKNLSNDIYTKKNSSKDVYNIKNLSYDIYHKKNLSPDTYNEESSPNNKEAPKRSCMKNKNSVKGSTTGKKVRFENITNRQEYINQDPSQEYSQENNQDHNQEHYQETNKEHNQDNKTKTNKKRNRNINRKNKITEVTLMYANVNGIKEKVNSLQQNASACGAHIVLVTETKQIPPKLQEYDKWKSRERKERAGGGVGICARKDIASKITKIENMEDDEQDIVWVEMSQTKNKKLHIGCYYGKQENDKVDTLDKEYQQLDTQLSTIIPKGEAVLTGDFNAKLGINEDNYQQECSKGGNRLKELIKKHKLIPISLQSKTGKWTRQKRNDQTERSIIDYILITPGLVEQVKNIEVDEKGLYRIKGKTETDHNTIILTLNMNLKAQHNKIKKWNLENEEGWKKFNETLENEYKNKDPQNQQELQKLITKVLKETVGEKTITTGRRSIKESDQTKELRKDRNSSKRKYEAAIKLQSTNKMELLQKYKQSQEKLKTSIAEDQKLNTIRKLQKFAKNGAAKMISFWKMKAEAEREETSEPYDLITEDNRTLTDPEESKEYIANYFEDLYQARPSKPEYKKISEQIEERVEQIEKEMQKKPSIPDFTLDDINRAIKKLKKKKATGPDNIPNEIFIKASKEVKEIYLKGFNDLNKTMQIPEEWQEGEIKRLYKGKGIKGKCSNERGITLSSNYGKLYERMINERVLKKINISDEQAGGKKGSATVDHIVLAKEIILSAKMINQNADISLLDVTKAYDKAWLTGIMHVLYKEGLTDNHWTIVKKLNEDLTAKIQTKYGLTRMIQIRDSIRQGGVLSTTMYGSLMDQVSKELKANDLGIPLYEKGDKKASLLWVDDVLLISVEGKLQPSLDITAKTSNTYHVEYGKSKSNTMVIKNNRKKNEEHAYEIGDMKLDQTNKYKYLGYMLNNKNNNEEQTKSIKGRTEAAYQNMMALTGNSTFSQIEMETIWTVMEACIIPTITYSGEAWHPSKKNLQETNQIMDNILKRILKLPKNGTPREALYMETGLYDPEMIIKRNRINMEARIRNGENETMKQILTAQHPDSWIQQNKKIKEEMNITEEEMEKTQYEIKAITKKQMKQAFRNRIITSGQTKSKMNYYYERRTTPWEPKKRTEYMNKLTRNQASTIFKARTRMTKVKSNYKNGNTDMKCRLCGISEETQKHAFEECETINKTLEKVTEQMIFNEDTDELRTTANLIEKRMHLYEETGKLCHKESNKSRQRKQQNNHTAEDNTPAPRINTDLDDTLPYGEDSEPNIEELKNTINPDLDETLPYGEDIDTGESSKEPREKTSIVENNDDKPNAPTRCDNSLSTSAIGGERTMK